jgi:hypothetical protein
MFGYLELNSAIICCAIGGNQSVRQSEYTSWTGPLELDLLELGRPVLGIGVLMPQAAKAAVAVAAPANLRKSRRDSFVEMLLIRHLLPLV